MQINSSNKKRLFGVQALRGIAALLVLIQHSYLYAGFTLNLDSIFFRQFGFGTIGVYLFFIISGYIIYKKIDAHFLDFSFKRIARIYPTYFLSIVISFLLFYFFSRNTMPFFTNDLSQLLIPTGQLNGSFQIPYWTLIYEVFFYAVFSLSLLSVVRNPRQSILIICVIWIALIFYSLFILKVEIPNASPTISQIVFAKPNLYFIVGVLLSMSDEHKHHYLLIFGLILATLSATPFGASVRYDLNIMLLGVTAILVFERYSKYIPSLLIKIGDWSYGIYLLHLPIVYILHLHLTGRINSQNQGFLIILPIALLASTLFGYLDYELYHRIFNRFASRLYMAINSKTKMKSYSN